MASCSICFESLLSAPASASASAASAEASATGAAATAPTDDGPVSATPCGHVFHTACVCQWVRLHSHCPQCRTPATTETLVKLFLSEEQVAQPASSHHHRRHRREQHQRAAPAVGTLSGGDTLEREERRIVQDVLQCQLEDLSMQVASLLKQVSGLEDCLHQKVMEASGLEAELAETKRWRSEAEARERVGMEAAVLTDRLARENADLRTQMALVQAESAARTVLLQQVQEKVAVMEAQMVEANDASVGPHDSITIYESMDDLSVRRESLAHRRKACSGSCQGFCSCVKCALVIAFVVAAVVGLCVILPLKLIFREEDLTSAKLAV